MINRAEHADNFLSITNDTARATELSDAAFRLLIYALTCSDEWDFSVEGLAYCLGWPVKKTKAAVTELKRAGYIEQITQRGDHGHFLPSVWVIHEAPLTGDPKHGTPVQRETRSTGDPYNGRAVPRETRKRDALRNTNIKEKPNIKERPNEKKEGDDFSSLLAPLSPDLRDTFEEFVKMRKKIKAPLTEKALDLAIKKAEKLGDGDEGKMKAIVEQSILNSWKGLFELKDRPKAEPIIENPFTRLLREEGYT